MERGCHAEYVALTHGGYYGEGRKPALSTGFLVLRYLMAVRNRTADQERACPLARGRIFFPQAEPVSLRIVHHCKPTRSGHGFLGNHELGAELLGLCQR